MTDNSTGDGHHEAANPDADPGGPRAGETRLVLVTGLSGSGKSIAANALEDLGYYCVDNLPVSLLRLFLSDLATHAGEHKRIAIVTDVRSPGFEDARDELVDELERLASEESVVTTLVFLEASEETLVRRYSETRRSHPLGADVDRPVVDGIRREIDLLTPLRDRADRIFDTSDWSVHDMRKAVFREVGEHGDEAGHLVVSLVSFGFKHGPPAGADLMFDVRFLPNPYFIPGLREQTGKDAGVRQFLDDQDAFGEFLGRLEEMLLFLLPRYRAENRRYLTVAIGCTGGRHRSVASTEEIARRLEAAGWPARLSHRDVVKR